MISRVKTLLGLISVTSVMATGDLAMRARW